MKAASLIPKPQAVVQQVLIALVATLVVAWIVGHTPTLRAWLKAEAGDGSAS